MDHIDMQVLTPQDASGSNQCHIKSRRERRSSIRREEDALWWQLGKITLNSSSPPPPQPVNVGYTMHWRRKCVWSLILMSAALRDRLKMICVKCFLLQIWALLVISGLIPRSVYWAFAPIGCDGYMTPSFFFCGHANCPEDVLPNRSPFRDRKKRLLSTIFIFFRHVFDIEYVITEGKKKKTDRQTLSTANVKGVTSFTRKWQTASIMISSIDGKTITLSTERLLQHISWEHVQEKLVLRWAEPRRFSLAPRSNQFRHLARRPIALIFTLRRGEDPGAISEEPFWASF